MPKINRGGKRLPKYRQAVIKRNKLKNYLLNPSKSTKAAFFNAIGYNMQNWKRFESDIRKGISQNNATARGITNKYGHTVTAYTVKMPLGINTKATVITGWEVEGNGAPNFITAYPDRKGGKSK